LDFEKFPVEPPNRTLFEIDRGALGDPQSDHELGNVSLGGSLGLSFSPVGFYTTGEADFWFARFFSIGPLIQFSIGRDFIFAASGGPKLTFDFADNDFTDFVKPYVQAGAGIVLIAGERGPRRDGRSRAEVGLLLNLGMGVDFYIDEQLSLGTGFLFNIMPTDPLDEVFFWGWKMIEAKVHF
jgi:hypothetical protein